ncbi:MAG: peptidyl-prolyl cis-trans isomerase [Kofleriaceae bacterium]|nr:peptidyl-prolyl cis-trans isomerase [Kofleriaceae bacterium]
MRVVRPTSAWRGLVREPLVHFVAIGVILFAVDAWRGGDRRASRPAVVVATAAAGAAVAATSMAPPPARAPIVVDAAARAQIAARAERHLGRAATAAELVAETEAWIDEELLYREALERGLDRDDPMIHERLASRMSYVLAQATIVPEPTEAELRAWFAAHRDRWTVPERLDFTHVFVAGTDDAAAARADGVAAALAAGAAPEGLGDRFAAGHRFRGRPLADLARAFGDEFVAGLDDQVPGAWVRRRSRFGLHLVRVDRVVAGRAADFAAARLDVREAWRQARSDAAVAAAVRRERAGWEIVRP